MALVVVALLGAAPPAAAAFLDSSSGGASFSSAVLARPSNLTAANASCSLLNGASIRLTWTATTSSWADGYEVRRSTTKGGPYSTVASPGGAGTTSVTIAGHELNRTYHFVVRARAGAWRSVDSNEASVTTPLLCV